jgi:hypothetical protein
LHLLLITNSQKNNISVEGDINPSHKLAVIEGYATAGYVEGLVGKGNFSETKTSLEGYQNVDEGIDDGFVTYLYVYDYMV